MPPIAAVLDLEAFSDGTAVADIAAALGVTIVAVRQVLERDPRWANGARRPDIDVSDVVAMHAAGWSQVAIAYSYGYGEATVSRRLRQAGVI